MSFTQFPIRPGVPPYASVARSFSPVEFQPTFYGPAAVQPSSVQPLWTWRYAGENEWRTGVGAPPAPTRPGDVVVTSAAASGSSAAARPTSGGIEINDVSELATHVAEWRRRATDLNKPFKYFCGVDVGGTNTRVAISSNLDDVFIQIAKFPTASTRTLLRKLEELAQRVVAIAGQVSSGGCIDLAGPITDAGNKVTITNVDTTQGVEHAVLLRSELPSGLFPSSATVFLNDLESACYGIVALEAQGRLPNYFQVLFNGSKVEPTCPVRMTSANYLVCAMGTGLGVGIIRAEYTMSGVQYTVIPTEGGHGPLFMNGPDGPGYARDIELFKWFSHELYGGQFAIEYEDVCSGRGLVKAYEFFAKDADTTKKTATAKEVADMAMATPPDASAAQAMSVHYEYLMRCAQGLCVVTQCKGLFLAGDNQVHNRAFTVSKTALLKDTLLHGAKKAWLEEVDVYHQTTSLNINLEGCLFQAKRLGNKN